MRTREENIFSLTKAVFFAQQQHRGLQFWLQAFLQLSTSLLLLCSENRFCERENILFSCSHWQRQLITKSKLTQKKPRSTSTSLIHPFGLLYKHTHTPFSSSQFVIKIDRK